jgi:predicted Zn-dependent peptidase
MSSKQLENKLTYYYVNDPRNISVIFVLFNVGSKDEDEIFPAGISHFLEHVLFLGSSNKKFNSNELLYKAVDEIGGLINGMTYQHFTGYYIKVSNEYFDEAIEIMANLIQTPKFDEHDIERERTVVCEENNSIKTKPMRTAKELFETNIFKGSRISNSIGGTNGDKGTLANIHKNNMLEFYHKYYCPQNCAVICVSNKNPIREIGEYFGVWESKCNDNLATELLNTNLFKRKDYPCKIWDKHLRVITESRDTSQDNIIIGFPLFGFHHKCKITMDILNVIIGGMLTSRLFTRLRHKERLVYSINSFTQFFANCGFIMIITNVDNTHAEKVIQIIFEELEALRNKLVPEEELEKVKKNIHGVMDIKNENSLNIAMFYAQCLLLCDENILTIDQYLDQINKVNNIDIQKLAQEYLVVNKALVVCVGKTTKDKIMELF